MNAQDTMIELWLRYVMHLGLPSLNLLKEILQSGVDADRIITGRSDSGNEDTDSFLSFILYYCHDAISTTRYLDVDKEEIRAEAMEAIIFLVEEAGADVNNCASLSPLGCACTNPLLGAEATRYLLAKGADVETTSADNNTALHLAVFTGNLAQAQALLEAGIDMDILNSRGYAAFDLADPTITHGVISIYICTQGVQRQTMLNRKSIAK